MNPKLKDVKVRIDATQEPLITLYCAYDAHDKPDFYVVIGDQTAKVVMTKFFNVLTEVSWDPDVKPKALLVTRETVERVFTLVDQELGIERPVSKFHVGDRFMDSEGHRAKITKASPYGVRIDFGSFELGGDDASIERALTEYGYVKVA